MPNPLSSTKYVCVESPLSRLSLVRARARSSSRIGCAARKGGLIVGAPFAFGGGGGGVQYQE